MLSWPNHMLELAPGSIAKAFQAIAFIRTQLFFFLYHWDESWTTRQKLALLLMSHLFFPSN